VIYVDNIMVAQAPYSLSWHLGGQTRAPSATSLALPAPLPAEFGIGIAAKMLHESGAKTRTFWQAGPYALRYDSADNKLKMRFGEATAEQEAAWSAGDIIGVYGGQRDGKLFLQSKVAGAVGERAEAEVGRNLLLNSKTDFVTVEIGQWGYFDFTSVPIDGENVSHGDDITFSIYVKDIPDGEQLRLRVDWLRADNTYDYVTSSDIFDREGRYSFTTNIPTDISFTRIRARLHPLKWTDSYRIKYKHNKLELGSTPTPWTPAPEDYEPIEEITIGSDGETEHVNAVLADFVLNDSGDINPAGYLSRVPGGGST